MDRSDFFARNFGRVDIQRLTDTFVVMVGVGSVGSSIAQELARGCGVGHLVLCDGDHLDEENLSRHALPALYLGLNKAEAMASYLRLNVPDLDIAGAPFHLDGEFSDEQIDLLFAPADLVVIATDQLPAQRRLAARALAMDIPAVIPALYGDHGGEVFVQLSPREACFRCWDDFREPDAQVRGVTSINSDSLNVIQQAMYMCLALLESDSRHSRDLAPSSEDSRPRQLFQLRHGGALLRSTVTRRPGCPGCAVGPSALNAHRPSGAMAGPIARRMGSTGPRAEAAGWPLVLTGEQAPPIFRAVTLNEDLVLEGSHVTLSWEAENATNVEVETLAIHPASGSLRVLVTETTAFQLRAVNPFGQTRATSPVVRAVPLPRLREVPVPRLVALRAAPEAAERPLPGQLDPRRAERSPVSHPARVPVGGLSAVAPRPLRVSAFATGGVVGLPGQLEALNVVTSQQQAAGTGVPARWIRRIAELLNPTDTRPR